MINAAMINAYQSSSLARNDSRIDDVTLAAPRLDQSRAELSSQRRDVYVHDVRHRSAHLVVDVRVDHLAADESALLPDQKHENRVLAGRELDRTFSAIGFPGRGIK